MTRWKKRVMLRDVAERAGVSMASASIILNKTGNYESMLEETRKRVEKAADELGYQPNYAAKALREQSTFQVGVVIPNIASSFMRPLIMETSKAIRQNGYNMILYDLTGMTDEQMRETLINVQRSGIVDGLIIHGLGEIVAEIVTKVPAVYIDTRSCKPSVCFTEIKACYDLVEMFFRQGLTKLAFANGDIERESFFLREKGFRKAHADYRIPVNEQLIGYFPINIYGGVKAFEWIESMEERPEAIIILSDIMTYGFMLAARRNSVIVPDDIGVASMEDLEMSELFIPSITCSRIDIAQMSRLAVDELFSYMRTGEIRENHTVPTELVERESSRKYKA
jgi:DNA-binding LacI/PurR family transcriptional regulator